MTVAEVMTSAESSPSSSSASCSTSRMSALLSSLSSPSSSFTAAKPLLSSLSERGALMLAGTASLLRPQLLRVIELGVSKAVDDADVLSATGVKKEAGAEPGASRSAAAVLGLSPAGAGRLLPSGFLPHSMAGAGSSTARVCPTPLRGSRASLQLVSPLCKSRSLSSPSLVSPERSGAAAQQGASSSLRSGSLLLSARSSSRSLQSHAAPPSPRSPAASSELLSVCASVLRRLGSSQVKEDASVIAGRIQLSNILALLLAAVSLLLSVAVPLLLAPASSSFGQWAALLCRLCPLCFLLVPLLNELGHNVVSRVALLLMTHCWLLLLTLAWPGCGWPSFHYGALPLSLVLFDAALDSLPFLLSILAPLAANVASATVNAIASPALAGLNSLLSYAVLAAILHELLTQYRRNEASLLSASRSSRAAYTAMTSLMHSISHELRTPLNAVTGYTELLLLDPALSSSQQDMVRTIADNADALTKLVSDFLTFSSSSHGQLRVEAEIVDVEEMMDACLGSHALAAHRKGVELVYDIDDDVPALVLADGQRVREVLSNLITNSITASQQGCVHVRVGLDSAAPVSASPASASSSAAASAAASASSSPSSLHSSLYPSLYTLRFEVTDEGAGLTLEQQEHLFQPFSTLHSAASSSSSFGKSRGLGLAICHSLVQLMGGRIGVVSDVEGGQLGSVFWFTVQVHQVDLGGGGSGSSSQSAGSRMLSQQQPQESETVTRRILTVSEGDEAAGDDASGQQAQHSRSSSLSSPSHSSRAVQLPESPVQSPSALPRHVLVVSSNVTARNCYARLLLQRRGWLVSVCRDEQEARCALFTASPPPPPARVCEGSGGRSSTPLKRALSTPAMVEDKQESGRSEETPSPPRPSLLLAPPAPRPFDCLILDQTGGLELPELQRFALAVQSRLELPCLILKLCTACDSESTRDSTARERESGHGSPLRSSPFTSESRSERTLGCMTSASPCPATASSTCSSTSSSTSSLSSQLQPSSLLTPSLSATSPPAPLLPRPPSLHKPHYSNVTPPASHVAQVQGLISAVSKPVRWTVLVERLQQLMDRAGQRSRDRRQRQQQAQQQQEQQQQQQLEEQREEEAELQRKKEQPQQDAGGLDSRGGLPPLHSAARGSGVQPLLLSSPTSPSDLQSPTRVSTFMLRSLDKLTAAARASSAPDHHSSGLYHPSRLMHGQGGADGTSRAADSAGSSRAKRESDSGSGRSDDGDDASDATTEPAASSPSTSSSCSSSSSTSSSACRSSASRQFCPAPPSDSLSPSTSLSELRVLVAEDTVTNQKLITHMLRRLGITAVTIAPDGQQCLDIIHEQQRQQPQQQQQSRPVFDLLLMDLLMPNMDGWTATQRLRAEGWEGPIVALSASAMKGDRQRCDEVGCSGFMAKPVKLAVLRDTIERVCLISRS